MQSNDSHASSASRILAMAALIASGEVIFFLPFVIARVFRPTLLDVFDLTNLQLGVAFSVYGVVAMVAYFPGGPLADRYDPRKLMTVALVATSLGGIVMASLPSFASLKCLYGFWGVTTILLFWAPLIRATRRWSGGRMPGKAFGLLDGGRGLVAAIVGSLAVTLFAGLLPSDQLQGSIEQRAHAFQYVILAFSGVTFGTAVLVFFALPSEPSPCDATRQKFRVGAIGQVMRMPTVWLQGAVVVCAYVGYKGLDDISLYAHEALGLDEVQAAKVAAATLWLRPVAAVAAGLVADRVGVTRMTACCFVAVGLGSGLIAAGGLRAGMLLAFALVIVATSSALFALRGLYFAIMEEGRVPFACTGTAVGIVSVIGYTPDVFMGPLMGILLDRSPGPAGHHHVFAVVSGFAWIGFAAAIAFAFCSRSRLSESANDSSVG